MSTMPMSTDSTDPSTTPTTVPFEDRSFQFPDGTEELFERFDLAWTTPLGVARELRHDNYEKVGSRCIEDDCVGHLWADSAGVVCDKCGRYIRKDESVASDRGFDRGDPWEWLFEHRPTYRSGRRKCVGGLAHYEWYSNDDLGDDEHIGAVDPREFYRE